MFSVIPAANRLEALTLGTGPLAKGDRRCNFLK